MKFAVGSRSVRFLVPPVVFLSLLAVGFVAAVLVAGCAAEEPIKQTAAKQPSWQPQIYDLNHFTIRYDKSRYFGHPRMTVYRYYGDGEMVAGHRNAPCNYQEVNDVTHSHSDGYNSRAVVMLRRSTDGGLTWPEENNVILCDKTISEDQKKAFLYQPGAPRADYDMFSPDSLFFFARMYLAERRGTVCFALRSPDRGRTWESVPTIVNHPDGPQYSIERGCDPIIRMPDGKTLLAPISIHRPGSGIAIYSSTDNGVTWNFLSRAATTKGRGGFAYPTLLPMPGGELQLYTLNITSDVEVKGTKNAICLTSSFDDGRTWSQLRPIVSPESQGAWGTDITPIIRDGSFGHWTNLGKSGANEKFYRSPWAILLNDGRILVVFARRRDPIGLGGVVSEDGGRTWSNEFVIRDDGPVRDLGYQVGSQLEDGRIVISYYYSVADGNKFGGTRCILGSSFRIK